MPPRVNRGIRASAVRLLVASTDLSATPSLSNEQKAPRLGDSRLGSPH